MTATTSKNDLRNASVSVALLINEVAIDHTTTVLAEQAASKISDHLLQSINKLTTSVDFINASVTKQADTTLTLNIKQRLLREARTIYVELLHEKPRPLIRPHPGHNFGTS